jgi:outer membrane protein insertion porin family
VEFRIPIFWRFGGVLGVDAGRVWRKLSEFDLNNWATNAVIGLRLHMDTFIVRLDVGVSKETTGLYLNFGQVF